MEIIRYLIEKSFLLEKQTFLFIDRFGVGSLVEESTSTCSSI